MYTVFMWTIDCLLLRYCCIAINIKKKKTGSANQFIHENLEYE